MIRSCAAAAWTAGTTLLADEATPAVPAGSGGGGGGARRRRPAAQAPASGTQEAPRGKRQEGVEAAAAETRA
jgi:hypothetical protein